MRGRFIAEAGGHPMRIIAKIENQEGLDNLDEIIDAADGIMVARGDLGVEVEFEQLPAAQRDMVRRCVTAGKAVIVATHLLESMIDNPMPTRAEVTDVANAVYEQVDAVMLSGETATGKYAVRCVSVLDRIARRTEKERGLELHRDREAQSIREHLARSACRLADSLGSRAIVVITMRGLLGHLVSSFRPRAIIYAFTTTDVVRRRLWLSRSVVPFTLDPDGGAGAIGGACPRTPQSARSTGERRTGGDRRERRHQPRPRERHPGAHDGVRRRRRGRLTKA